MFQEPDVIEKTETMWEISVLYQPLLQRVFLLLSVIHHYTHSLSNQTVCWSNVASTHNGQGIVNEVVWFVKTISYM